MPVEILSSLTTMLEPVCLPLKFPLRVGHLFFFEPVCYDSVFSGDAGLPNIKQIGTQSQHDAAVEASKQAESTEIVLDSNSKSLLLPWKNSMTKDKLW